jgi:putative ABC transport system permease protein
MGLSGFLVINTISALLAQQTRQIGIMKTIGARRGQIVAMYLFGVLTFGVLALIVAVPLGAIASFLFTSYMAGLLNFDIAFRVPLEAVLLEVGIGLTIPLLAAAVPIMAGVRITVREAIASAGGAGHFGTGFIDRAIQRVRGLPRPTLLSLRNTFRRKARLGLTLFTLTLGGAIFIAVLTVHTSFLATLNQALDYWNYDVNAELNRPYRVEAVLAEALRVPGVVAAEAWNGGVARRVRPDGSESTAGLGTRQGPQGVESDNMRILALPADTRVLAPQLIDGRWLVDGDTRAVVVNTDVLKDETDIAVGSTMRLKIEDKEEDFTVVGVVKSSLSGSWIYVNGPYFAELTNRVGRASSVQVVTDDHSLATQQRVATALKEHLDSVGITVSSTQTVMAVILAVVGGIGLMGTMSINVLERSREIGVMRAIGAADRSVLTIFMYEGVLIGLISWVLGGILSFPISRLLSDAVGIAFVQEPLTYSFATAGAGLWLFLVIVLALLASFWPSFRASRITVREVLAYE